VLFVRGKQKFHGPPLYRAVPQQIDEMDGQRNGCEKKPPKEERIREHGVSEGASFK